MDVVISVPEYDVQRGLHVEWEDGFEIGVDVDEPRFGWWRIGPDWSRWHGSC
ncbi:hypothetical protein [Kribbella sp. NBC_00889]|uniref:hypothetical protein n=1 Tax=Kribbella sp. NBC_00889 TaxID=2975974 RepID=UPI0038679217|nr:hypothetical protein OG817_09285 [Kribbella sp. NBC_00889]